MDSIESMNTKNDKSRDQKGSQIKNKNKESKAML